MRKSKRRSRAVEPACALVRSQTTAYSKEVNSLRSKLQNLLRVKWRTAVGEPRVDDESLWAGSAQRQPRPRLVDSALDRHLEEHGYAVIESFLDPFELNELIALFRAEPSPLNDKPFASSIRSDDPAYKSRVNEGMKKVFEPHIRRHFNGYRYRFAGFLVKAPSGEDGGDEGTVPLHQDIAMLNEALYQGLGIWVPLVETNSDNGCLRVVPGSHKYSLSLRWPGGPFAFHDRRDSLSKKAVSLPLAAGSAVVYCQKLIHASDPNRSRETRIVAGALAAPEGAQLVYYHQEGDDSVLDVYAVDDHFYVSHTYGTRPEGALKIARVRKRAGSSGLHKP